MSAQGTPKGEGPLDRQLQERRNDPEFRERLERSIEENKALLKSLGEKGIEPLVDPSPPDHNPEQVVERLRAMDRVRRGEDHGVVLGAVRWPSGIHYRVKFDRYIFSSYHPASELERLATTTEKRTGDE